MLGHEGAGEVVRTGDGVTEFQPGDRVMLNWAIPCGVCFQCVRGRENICEDRGTVPDSRFHHGAGAINASFSPGTMATHAVVSQAAVLLLDEAATGSCTQRSWPKTSARYEEFSGGHEWDYWRVHVEQTLRFTARF